MKIILEEAKRDEYQWIHWSKSLQGPRLPRPWEREDECDLCRPKPGSPDYCYDCLMRRELRE